MRAALSDALVEAARRDPKLILLTGDHGYALFDAFRAEHPDRYLNAGIAEQNMVGVAAGLAMGGYHPVVYGLSAFVPIRVLEQIKMDVCYLDLPVVFLGDGAGVVYSNLGSSHQSTEDIAAVRSVPNITVLSPADRHEMTSTFELACQLRKPVYLRVGKADLGDIHSGPVKSLEVGQLLPLNGHEAPTLLLATGSMVSVARDVVEALGPDLVRAVSAPSLKPLDLEQLLSLARPASAVITLEEHSVLGGFGSIVTELLSEHLPRPVLRIGVADCFSTCAGSWTHLMYEHGLDLDSVLGRVTNFIERQELVV